MQARQTLTLLFVIFWTLGLRPIAADQVNVAVAANFTAPMKEIAAAFAEATGHQAVLSFGSTGKLYTQIVNGAPFVVFLAADQERPERLEREGLATGRFTYASGRLVLWSRSPGYVDADGRILFDGDFRRLAIANPKTAPYGSAAMQVIDGLGLGDRLTPRLVRGDSIAQTHQFVATGNAELGFVALAQVVLDQTGSQWPVPQSMHDPIRQDAVLLRSGAEQPAAQALMDFLHGAQARSIIARYGYLVD